MYLSDDGDGSDAPLMSQLDVQMEEDIERMLAEDDLMDDSTEHLTGPDDDHAADDDDEDEVEEEAQEDLTCLTKAPIIYPRARFAGACNVETVKDVNFLGPRDEFVASGSDDGNFFIWKKSTRQLHGILEGDGSVVNVIEQHPHLPLVAVSGIDTTVKLFAPAHGASAFSRLGSAESIIRRNSETASRRIDLTSLFLQYQLARRTSATVGEDGPTPGCTYQ